MYEHEQKVPLLCHNYDSHGEENGYYQQSVSEEAELLDVRERPREEILEAVEQVRCFLASGSRLSLCHSRQGELHTDYYTNLWASAYSC